MLGPLKKLFGKAKSLLTTRTKGYRANIMWYPGLFDINDIPFNGFIIEAMLHDEMVSIAFKMLTAPLSMGKWEIDGPSEVQEWADKQLKKFQDYSWMLKQYMAWGWGGYETLWELKSGLIALRGFRDFHPFDLRPMSLDGEIAAVRVKHLASASTSQGQVDLMVGKRSVNLGGPKGLWLSHFPRYGSYFGSSAFRPAFKVWLEKSSKDGAEDIRRLWFYKNAFRGDVMWFPSEDYVDSTGKITPAKDVAQQFIELIKTGGVVALPSDRDEKGERKWELREPQMGDAAQGILDYIDRLDNRLRRGIGIPDDVIEQPDGGGTYGGRRIGWEAFLVHMQSVWNYLLHTFDEQCLRPAAMMNFGEDVEYEIVPTSLLEAEKQQMGMQPGQPGSQQPGEPREPAPERGGGLPGQQGQLFGEHNFSKDMTLGEIYRETHEQLAELGFEERKHPRVGKGHEDGGRFTSKGSTAGDDEPVVVRHKVLSSAALQIIGRPTKPHERVKADPPVKKFVSPPAPKASGSGKAGGYAANGKTNTEVGDMVEELVGKLGLRSIILPGVRQGPLDREYDHSGWAFEIKAVTTEAAEYKIKMKAHEMDEKRAYAKKHRLKPGMLIAVFDYKTKNVMAYWREGIGSFRLTEDEAGERWNYLGTVSFAKGA